MIRPFEAKDELHVLAIWSAYVQKYHDFLSDEWMAETRFLMSTKYIKVAQIYVYEHNERVVGFIGMLGNDVGLVFVESLYQGKGFAHALLESVESAGQELTTSVYTDNHVGRKFYERHGFEFIKEKSHQQSKSSLCYYKKTQK